MSWLNNFRIAAKIGCIIVLMAVVIIATNGFAVLRMRDMDHTSTDIITRIDKSATVMARASRRAENYISSAFQLLEETTEAGNERLVNEAAQSQHIYKASMNGVLKSVPEKSDAISGAIRSFDQAFALCDPVIAEAARSTTVEGNQKATQRLKNECLPVAEKATAVQTKLVDDFMEEATDASNRLIEENGSATTTVVIGSIIGLLLGLAVAMLIGIKGLSQPIARLKSVMESFANNDLDPDVPGTGRQDELGEMARTVEIFKTNALEVRKLRDAQVEAEKLAAAQRKSDMSRLATEFEDAVGEIVGTLSSASTELEASANTLASTAGRAQELTTSVATASGQASGNVQSVAAATEEMSSSVGEIGRQVQEAAQIAQAAVSQAQKTNERVSNLAEAASRIGDVVELINTIAGQTNLLALNATIEAARAGEAGRGFAVVATEVKALAEQTAKATGEISQQIDGIQDATQASVAAIKEIGATINRMSEISSTIASAVEEQGAATNEISRNVQQAALGTAEVSTKIVDVQRGAAETGAASSQVLAAAEALSRDSTRLKVELGRFLNTVRAA